MQVEGDDENGSETSIYTEEEIAEVFLVDVDVPAEEWDNLVKVLGRMQPRRLRLGCCSEHGGHDLLPLGWMRMQERAIVACYASLDTEAEVVGVYGYVEGEGELHSMRAIAGGATKGAHIEEMIRKWCLARSFTFRDELRRQRLPTFKVEYYD